MVAPAPALPGPVRRLVASQGVSILGDRLAEVALPLAVLDRTGGLALAGLVGAANVAAGFLLPHALGRLVDRRDPWRLLVAADLARTALYATIALVVAVDALPLALLLPLAAATGLADVLAAIAGTTALAGAAPPEGLLRANSRLESADAGASLAGPALAGLLVTAVGPWAALALDAATFAASAALLAGRPARPATSPATSSATGRVGERPSDPAAHQGAEGGSDGPRLGARHVAALVWRAPPLRAALVSTIGLGVHVGGVVLALVAIGRDALGLSAAATGAVVAAAGAGALLSSLLVTPRLGAVPWPRALRATLVVSAVALAIAGVAPTFAVLAAATLVMDAAVSSAFVVAGTLRQASAPRDLLGRVTALTLQAGAAARIAGSLVAGATATLAGGRGAVVVPAIVLFAAASGGQWRASSGAQRLTSRPDWSTGT